MASGRKGKQHSRLYYLLRALTQPTETASIPPLLQITIEQASKALEDGDYTSSDLVKAYLARIDEASSFRAVLQTNPDAMSVAQALDKERKESGPRR